MSGWTPPSIPRVWLATLGVLSVAILAFSVFIEGALLLGLIPIFALVSVYLLWRFLRAAEAIADALQRIARERERE